MTHTPGPWRYIANGNCYYGVEGNYHDPEYGIADHGNGVERHAVCTAHGTKAQANARLIAAAPELLAACEAIVALSEDHGRMNLPEAAGIAKFAIRQVRGG